MIWMESLMMAVVMYTAISATWSDCRSAIIANTLIIRSMAVSVVLNGIYYGIWGREYLALFLTNLVAIVLIAFLFYTYHIWAAGDSKLLFAMGLGIPARLYSFWNLGPVPVFAILVIVFSVAFIYITVDSIVCGIRRKSWFSLELQKTNFIRMIFSYLFMVAAMRICNQVLILIAGDYLYHNNFLMTAIDFFIILSLIQIRERISNRIFYIVTAASWSLLIALYFLHIISYVGISFDLKSWLVVVVVMFFRIIAEHYNYQEILTEEVKERMIPAAATVLMFRTSKVQKLPVCITEDLRARLTRAEVDAILRWRNSKQGKPTIFIVRKIPFAIFITIGTVMFLILEGLALWHII